MAKPEKRSYSRYSQEAAQLLGTMIRNERVTRKITVADLAERAGVSRGLLHRVERGDMRCSIGTVFEIATILGIPLFEPEQSRLTNTLAAEREKQKLLPESVRLTNKTTRDDF